MEEGPTSLTGSNGSSKVKEMTHILRKSQGGDSGLHSQNVPVLFI